MGCIGEIFGNFSLSEAFISRATVIGEALEEFGGFHTERVHGFLLRRGWQLRSAPAAPLHLPQKHTSNAIILASLPRRFVSKRHLYDPLPSPDDLPNRKEASFKIWLIPTCIYK